MEYLKATKKQCEDYNSIVSVAEKYDGISTTQWAEVIEIEGLFYIPFNENYPSELTKVKELPVIEADV